MLSGLIVVLTVTSFGSGVNGYPTGAPLDQCQGMQPDVSTHGTEQSTETPYRIKPFYNTTLAGSVLTVRIDGGDMKGMLLEARVKETGEIIGTWSEYPILVLYDRFKTIDCNGPDSAVTHYDNVNKRSPFYFQWTPPINASGNVEFIATIVKTKTEYWRGVTSEIVYVESLGNCTIADYHLFESCTELSGPLGALNSGFANPEGVCSAVSNALDSIIECVGSYVRRCEAAGDKATYEVEAKALYDTFIDHKDAIYNGMCDECGRAEVHKCYYNLTLLDLTDLDASCSAYQGTSECMSDLRSICTPLNRTYLPIGNRPIDTEMAERSLQANLHQCLLIESCPTVAAKKATLESCIPVTVSDPLTLDNVCTVAEEYTNCMLEAVDGCDLLNELLTNQLTKMRAILPTFGCQTAGFSPQEKDCNQRRLLECYNPLLDHLSLLPVNGVVSLDELLSAVKETAATLTDLNRTDTCNSVENILQNASHCFMRESMKCSFNPLLQELDVSIPELVSHHFALDPLIRLNPFLDFDLFDRAIHSLKEITAEVNGVSEEIGLWCEEDCANTGERISDFLTCSQNISENIGSVATSVLYYYQHGQAVNAEHCQPLREYMDCAYEYYSGCGFTESSIIPENDVALYQALHICGINPNINYRENSLCLDANYNNYLLKNVHESCQDITSEELSNLSIENLCPLLEEKMSCFVEQSLCCGLKKQIVEPRLMIWGIISHYLECGNVFNFTKLVPTHYSNCLKEIFDCYDPLTPAMIYLYSRNKYFLSRKAKYQEYYFSTMNRNESCPAIDFESIEKCVMTESSSCSSLPVCLNQNIAVTNESDPLPMADFFAFEQNRELCETDCANSSLSPESFGECDIKNITDFVHAILNKDLMGLDTATPCNSLQAAIECIKNTLGSCSAMENAILPDLRDLPLARAAGLCDVDVSFLAPEAKGWQVLQYTTTPSTPRPTDALPPISRAGSEVKGSIWVYVGVLICMIWVAYNINE